MAGATTLTIAQFQDRLEKIATPKQLSKAILPPFRKGLKTMQSALMSEYWSNKFGARIWKWRQEKFNLGGGPAVKLGSKKRRAYARWSQGEEAYVGLIFILGLAAKMELGGQLRRHVPYGRKELAYSPGLSVPDHRAFDKVVDPRWNETVDDIADSFGKFIERTL